MAALPNKRLVQSGVLPYRLFPASQIYPPHGGIYSNPILERMVLGSTRDCCRYMTVVLETVWPRIV